MAAHPPKRGRLIAILLVAVPLLLLLGALGFAAWTWNSVQNSDAVDGTVLSVESFAIDGGRTYKPVFAYTDAEGQRRRATTHFASSEYEYEVGTPVPLLIPRDQPSRARINTVMDLWLLPGALVAISAICLVIGLIAIVFTRSVSRRATERA